MDIVPHRVMRLLQLGLVDQALSSETIWVCASCQTCTTRCPNDIDIAHVMDTLRKLARPTGKAASKNARMFNAEFLSAVKQYGRLYELGMITRFTLRSQGLAGFLKQTGMGLNMVVKGKLKVLPHSLWPDMEVRNVFKQAERKEPK
ncbi:MAG: 4Fe-4S dicluster domain-containing protein, partial [Dehalococcoidales bacterium]|nr:4Fe-4S dicluster domain-containing protein [Dehalococcoidales bacterium]